MELLVSEIKAQKKLDREAALNPLKVLGKSSEFVTFQNPVYVSANAQLTYSDIVVQAKVKTIGTLNCARCLEDFEKEFKGDFTETFASNLDRISLTEDIRETIIIDIPIKPLCRENCKGICPSCGTNRNQKSCSCKPVPADRDGGQLKNFPFK